MLHANVAAVAMLAQASPLAHAQMAIVVARALVATLAAEHTIAPVCVGLLTLMEDAGVGTDLIMQPGQNVIISGDVGSVEAPRWGSGGFTVSEIESLSLSGVAVVQAGGALHMSKMVFAGHGYDVLLEEGPEFARQSGEDTFDSQCYEHLAPLSTTLCAPPRPVALERGAVLGAMSAVMS